MIDPALVARAQEIGWPKVWAEMRRAERYRKLSPAKQKAAKIRFARGETMTALARAFRVSRQEIKRAVKS